MNRDREVAKDIGAVLSYFSKVNYPAEPLHPETKEYLDRFFIDGFVALCDKIFGSLHDTQEFEDELSWMDLANISPNSASSTALFHLIAPSTPFINLLEAFSIPSPMFSTMLKKEWKSTNSTTESPSNKYLIDFPLSTLYPQSFRLLGESPDADLFALPRVRCPPILLIPFWEPPLMTRKEMSSKQIMTTLPCSPIAYFVLRLIHYVMHRSSKTSAKIISRRAGNGWKATLGFWKDKTMSYIQYSSPIEFPFFYRALTAYIQYYCPPLLTRHVSSRSGFFERAGWTTTDVVAALLITAPTQFSQRFTSPPPIVENQRTPSYDASVVAQVVSVIPFLTEMYIFLNENSNLEKRVQTGTRDANFCRDTDANAWNDIIDISSSLYRNCLIALRECLLALDGFPNCRCVHYNNMLELWLTLIHPHWRKSNKISEQYILHHYESYSFITINVLEFATKSKFVSSLDATGLTLLSKCLEALSNTACQNFYNTIMGTGMVDQGRITMDDIITQNCVLNWRDETGKVRLVNFRDDESSNLAAQLVVLLEKKLHQESLKTVDDSVRNCISSIEKIFPSANQFYAKWKQLVSSSPEVNNKAIDSSEGLIRHRLRPLSVEEKNAYFKGKGSSCVYVDQVRLPTNNGMLPGGHHPSLWTTTRQEIPVLVGISHFIDGTVEKCSELYYSNWIPKCDRGHNMWLLDSSKYHCVNHSTEAALWECSICEDVYGACCKGLPLTKDGSQLNRVEGPMLSMHCNSCGEAFTNKIALFASGNNFFCSRCASRPFKSTSTRFLASYKLWAIISIILIFWLIFKLFC